MLKSKDFCPQHTRGVQGQVQGLSPEAGRVLQEEERRFRGRAGLGERGLEAASGREEAPEGEVGNGRVKYHDF